MADEREVVDTESVDCKDGFDAGKRAGFDLGVTEGKREAKADAEIAAREKPNAVFDYLARI